LKRAEQQGSLVSGEDVPEKGVLAWMFQHAGGEDLVHV
jgi:hypothetical protein